MWERFFNWQSDMDWTWGPFLPLRPARNAPLRPWVWGRMLLVLSGLGLMGVGLVGAVCVWEPRLAVREGWNVPPGVAETVATLAAMGSDTNSRLLFAVVVLTLPLVFALACLPFHASWNRRAARLTSAPKSRENYAETTPEVWPPAPKQQ